MSRRARQAAYAVRCGRTPTPLQRLLIAGFTLGASLWLLRWAGEIRAERSNS